MYRHIITYVIANMTEENEDIEFVQAGKLKIGSHIVMDGQPCVIKDMSTSKTGKHGSAKANITAKNIFNGNRIDGMFSTTETVKKPIVTKVQYTISNIEGEFISLLDEHGEIHNDIVRLDTSDISKKVIEFFQKDTVTIVTVLSSLGKTKIVECVEDMQK